MNGEPTDPNPADHLKPHRWTKGRSGNPGGRPRGASMKKTLYKLLNRKHNGKTHRELLAEVLLREALKGKSAAIVELLDRTEGPVPRPGPAPAEVAGARTLVFNIVPAAPPAEPAPVYLLPGPDDDRRENARVRQ